MPDVAKGMRLVAIFERGALNDIEQTRAAIAMSAPVIEINPGFRFEMHRDVVRSRRFLAERGAVNDEAKLEEELSKSVAMIEVNSGFRFELMDI